RHRLRPLHEAFEDGTPNFLDLAALEPGFLLHDAIGVDRLSAHVDGLAVELVEMLRALRHGDGTPVVRLYGVPASGDPPVPRGATVSFNVVDPLGRPVPFPTVETRASEAGVMLRGGCFCNPGASEAAFHFDPDRMAHCLDAVEDAFSVPRLRQCAGPDIAVGAMRASLGMATNRDDIRRAADVIATFSAG
ncbi:MAG TPA: hypothetical protein VGL62_06445, partial [Vicinamibacterales bacterium]